MRPILPVISCLLLCSCASSPPGPHVIASAEQAIATAERVGAAERSPVELRFAREKLEQARLAIENRKYEEALMAIEQSEINAELAIEQSRTVLQRRRVNELRRANEVLRDELETTYGDSFE